MSFYEPDVVEDHLGVRVEKMTPQLLVNYVRCQNAWRDIDLKPKGHPERAVFRKLQEQYGQELAGRIVKWAFFRYDGRFRKEPIGYFHFTASRPWFCDRMSAEVQDHLRSHAAPATPLPGEFGTI